MIERYELAPGYSISRIVNGLWQLSGGHRAGDLDTETGVDLLLRLIDSGLTTFDCADIYIGVEELLGSLTHHFRRSGRDLEEVQIHTKYVPDRSTLGALKRGDVDRAIDGSLRRLAVERIDLVQLHWWDYSEGDPIEVAGWLTRLQEVGKIRHLGTTNFDRSHLRALTDAGIPLVSNQAQYSLLDRRVASGMASECADHGMGLLAYGVLAGGFLSGRYLDAEEPRPPLENRSLVKYRLIIEEFGGWAVYQRLLATLAEIANRHGTTIATVAARWVLDRPSVAAAMIGTRSDAHIEDNLRVFALNLDDTDRDSIDSVLARASGPTGEPFELERRPGGRHAEIMWTDLNRERGSG